MGEMLTKNFSKAEMACRCRRHDCTAPAMDHAFMALLQNLREVWGVPLRVTSGLRCEYWNTKNEGAPHSKHLLGRAADFWFDHPSDTLAFVELAEKMGFGGIGAGEHLVHLDNREAWARWTYPGK